MSTCRRGSGKTFRSSGRERLTASRRRGLPAAYVHPSAGNNVGALVQGKGPEEVARQLALHISAAKPTYATRDEVPAELVEAEREILAKQSDLESKPADVREKIIEGMINKRFYAEAVLNETALDPRCQN